MILFIFLICIAILNITTRLATSILLDLASTYKQINFRRNTMLYSIDKAVGLARDLADEFKIRLSNGSGLNTVRQAQDAQGWPMIFLSHNGNEAEAQPVIALRIKNIDVGATDIFGNSTLPFAPHQCEIAYELTSGGAPIPTIPDYTTVVFQVSRTGVIVDEEAIANGTAVTEASMNAAQAAGPTLVLKDIDWRNSGNV